LGHDVQHALLDQEGDRPTDCRASDPVLLDESLFARDGAVGLPVAARDPGGEDRRELLERRERRAVVDLVVRTESMSATVRVSSPQVQLSLLLLLIVVLGDGPLWSAVLGDPPFDVRLEPDR
jgi:hypothetical protein